jgi:hypothetical protein
MALRLDPLLDDRRVLLPFRDLFDPTEERRYTPSPCSGHRRYRQERGFDQFDQFTTDAPIAQHDSAVCEHVCDVGYLGRPRS